MTGPFSGSVTVQDERAAQALLDPRTPRLLEAFWTAPRSVSDVASALGMSLDSLLYRVRRLEQLSLLQHTDTRERRGRPIKLYRAAAQAFFVPFEATPYETLEAYLAEVERDVAGFVRRNVARTLEATGAHWGLRVAPGPDGHLQSKLAVCADHDWTMTPEGPALLSFVYPALQLDFADAKALQAELMAVFSRYAGREGAGTYVCQMVLCPVTEPLERS
ncbi:ArsR/SmtB family transcription factor [Deinococcus hohokamensis]|uniref:ArsR/SmtB family transcription factor n=1 Tax=Deinococcus hohokamensis TaxID=309883 RepID=A0ABV9I8S8_9DEIO